MRMIRRSRYSVTPYSMGRLKPGTVQSKTGALKVLHLGRNVWNAKVS